MNFKRLAEKAVAAKTEAQRKSVFKEIPAADLPELAVAIKEICYSLWMSAPTKARAAAAALHSLSKFSSQEEIKAYAQWIGGIKEITRGNLTAAVARLDEATEVFKNLGQAHESAQPQVAKLYALALLGRFAEAVETGKKALRIFEKHDDLLAAGKVEKNLGNLFSRRELHTRAERFYLSAREKFVKLDDFKELAMVENGLAITSAARDDFRRAERIYRRALQRAENAQWLLMQAEIEASIGNLALFRGRLEAALKYLELSRRKYEILEMPHQTAIAELEIADAYLELNLFGEAISIYERIADRFRQMKLPAEEARARANFGRAAARLNDARTARRELKKAARLYISAKNNGGAAAVKSNEAQIELDAENYRKVLELTDQAEALLEQSENKRDLLNIRWLRAEALRYTGENKAAGAILERIFAESKKREQPQAARAAQVSLGKIAVAENDLKCAKAHFRRAIRLIEKMRAPLAAEEFRMAFLANKLAPFELLAKIYLAENKLEAAFLMIEKARSRVLAESLDNAAQTTLSDRKTSAPLSNKLNDLREELNWFYSRLRRAADAEINNLQTEAEKREKQIADVQRQIASTAESPHGSANSLDFKELQNRLGEKSALIEFVNLDGIVSAFVVTDQKIHFVENLATESGILTLLEGLHFQFGSLRYGAALLNSLLPELKKRALFYLENLHNKLLAPLEKLIGERDLIIVPSGALHYVPFHALYDGNRYQIETREIVYATSATVWHFLASKPRRKLKNALLIGYADEQIPLVEREIENLRVVFPASESFTGAQATFAAFTQNAPRFDVVHLACHGQFRPENPMFSSLHLADGFVTVKDACAQRLRAEVVTLSACETGLHKIHAGDEILGLARGFLTAGAKSLILSLWTVNDAATLDLMQTFYAELQTGKTAAAALRTAQCRMIERGLHPYFWSPFALIGR